MIGDVMDIENVSAVMKVYKMKDGSYEWNGKNVTAEEIIVMGAMLTEAGLKMMEDK